MSIKIENVDVFGLEAAVRGARNPMNSWDKSDSRFFEVGYEDEEYPFGINHYHKINKEHLTVPSEEDEAIEGTLHVLGPNDHKLLTNLCKGGTEESKWRRMVHVQMDVTAPLYWWKEFDTYKVGTVSNSCSTMHKIHAKEFTLEDFSCEHLFSGKQFCSTEDEALSSGAYATEWDCDFTATTEECEPDGNLPEWYEAKYALDVLNTTIEALNYYRTKFLETKDKKYWYQMIQMLPTSYNQRRTIDLNYEVLASQYRQRKDHKLDEWRQYCDWIKTLPYSEFITMEE